MGLVYAEIQPGRRAPVLILCLCATMGGGCSDDAAPQGEPPVIESFDGTPGWGDAPLTGNLAWSVRGGAGTLRGQLDVDGDGVFDATLDPLPATGQHPFNLTVYGAYYPILSVTDQQGRTVVASTRLYANFIKMASNVVQPAQLTGYQAASLAGERITIYFGSGSALPTLSPGTILFHPQGETPFLRKIVQVTANGARLDIDTVEVGLMEAVEEAFVGVRDVPLGGKQARCSEDCDGVTVAPSTGLLDLSGRDSYPLNEPALEPAMTGVEGASVDFPSERFTLDPQQTQSVEAKAGMFAAVMLEDFVFERPRLTALPKLVRLRLRSLVEVTVTPELNAEVASWSRSLSLGTIALGTVQAPIPLFVSLRPTMELSVSGGGSVKGKLPVSARLQDSIGFSWEAGGAVQPSLSPRVTAGASSLDQLTVGGPVRVRATVTPAVRVKLLGLVESTAAPAYATTLDASLAAGTDQLCQQVESVLNDKLELSSSWVAQLRTTATAAVGTLELVSDCGAAPDGGADGAPRDAGPPDAAPPLDGAGDFAVPDAPVPDAPVPDAPVPDAPVPDAPVPDAPVPDAPVPDAPPVPDLAQPDLAQPDLAQPDLAQPDLAQPDLSQPDSVPPDSAAPLPDLGAADSGLFDAALLDVLFADVMASDSSAAADQAP